MHSLGALIVRDLRLALRDKSGWLQGLFFFVIFIALAGVALGGNNTALKNIATAIIWLAIIFALLLSFQSIFEDDFQDGSLEQIKTSSLTTPTYVTAKFLSHWIIVILPLIVVLPLVTLLLNLSFADYAGLLYSVLFASPALIILGGFCAACMVGSKSSNYLIILLAVPLFIPIVIFGTSSATSYVSEGLKAVEFKALLGLCLISIAIGIPATAAALDAAHE